MYILNPLPLRVRDFFVSVLNRKVTSYTSLRNSIPVLLGSFLKEVYYEYYLRKIRSFVYTGRELLRLFTHARTVLRLRGKRRRSPWKSGNNGVGVSGRNKWTVSRSLGIKLRLWKIYYRTTGWKHMLFAWLWSASLHCICFI